MNSTKKEMRMKLPGYQKEELLAEDDEKSLVHIFCIRGFMEELLTVTSFQIRYKNSLRVDSYNTLNEAYQNWDK